LFNGLFRKAIVLDLTLVALVDVIALLGAVIFLWRGARRAWRFVRLAGRTSVGTALRRSRFVAARQAFRCATDLHYYISRLALFFSACLIGLTGLILVAASTDHVDWSQSLTLLALAAFVAWMSLRIAKLSRLVMAFRRRLRRRRTG
jgi:hypothetical protein